MAFMETELKECVSAII